jgi:hypothetical protein
MAAWQRWSARTTNGWLRSAGSSTPAALSSKAGRSCLRSIEASRSAEFLDRMAWLPELLRRLHQPAPLDG